MINEEYFLINEGGKILTKIDYVKLMGLPWCQQFIKKYKDISNDGNFDKHELNNPKKVNPAVGEIFYNILTDWLSGDNQEVTKYLTSNIELLRRLKKTHPEIFKLSPKHKLVYRGTNISDSNLKKFIQKTLNSKDWVDANIGYDDYKVFTGRKFNYNPKSELQSFSVDAKVSAGFGDSIIVTKSNDKDFYFDPKGLDKINPSYKEKETIHHGKNMMVYLAIDKDVYDDIVDELTSKRSKRPELSQVKFK